MYRLQLISIFILTSFSAIAQQYKAIETSISDGLSQSSVHDITQDREGYMWMGTQDGLNRFDGRTFKIFREEPFDTTSISSNYINSVHSDSKGRLWVGTSNHGLNIMLPGRTSFIRIRSGKGNGELSSNIITDIHEDKNGFLWIGTGNGLFRATVSGSESKPTFTFTKILLDELNSDSISDRYVNRIISGRKNQIWAATYMGIFQLKVNAENGQTKVVKWHNNANGKLSDKIFYAIAEDSKGLIWAGSKKGIDIMDGTGEIITSIHAGSFNQSGMPDDQVTIIFKASDGRMWIGFQEKGIRIVQYHEEDDKYHFELPSFTASIPVMLKGNAMSIFEDRITKGIVWTGFNAGGMVRLVPVTKKFITNHLNEAAIGQSFVVGLLKDPEDNLWIGTQEGLLKYNRLQNQYEYFEPSVLGKQKAVVSNYINGIVQAKNGDIIFGSGNSVFRLKKQGDRYQASVITLTDTIARYRNVVQSIYQDYSGKIFLVLRYSVYQYDPESGSISKIIQTTDESRVNDRGFFFLCAYNDQSGNLWVGTSSGLELYKSINGSGNEYTKKPITFRHNPSDTTSIRNHNVLCINEDKNGNIWVGTMNGLTRVYKNGSNYRFANYSTRHGLKNNVIYAIIPDKRTGHLWLSTNNGLTEFNPTGFAEANYDVHDGLQSNEFNSYAAYQTPDGEMYFGGIAGYTSFYPWQIESDTTKPQVSISSVIVNGTRSIDLDGITSGKTVELKYKDNSFTVSFTGIHYVDPQKIRYAYMLEGFQDDWTDAGSTGIVNFSQLPPGTYTFRVKASNSDGFFNEAGDRLLINIKPPFHKTIWFYLLLALVIAGVIYGIFKYRLSMRMQKIKEVEQIRRATAADFHDELGHKLTIISWFAEILKKKIGPEQTELRPHLDRIIEASGNLYHTMKDMLWAMDPDKDSVYDLYYQIREFGQELYDNTGIEFTAADVPASLRENILSPAHKRHILLIFKEVMHNSLKHAGGTATSLDLVSSNGHLKFRFRDNGKGFRQNGQPNGRGLENIKRRAGQIHAKLNIHSEDKGTVAELDIPNEILN